MEPYIIAALLVVLVCLIALGVISLRLERENRQLKINYTFLKEITKSLFEANNGLIGLQDDLDRQNRCDPHERTLQSRRNVEMTHSERRILLEKITQEIHEEMDRAENLYGPFHSLHEALAVIRGQYLELENAIFWGNKNGDNVQMVRAEALQVTAITTRLLMLLTPLPDLQFDLSDAEKEVD